MHHTDIEFFRELGRLEGGQNTPLNARILDIAIAKSTEHQKVGEALEVIRKHLGKYCDDPDLEEAAQFALQIMKEAMFPSHIRGGFTVRIARYLKSLSDNGSDGGQPGEAPESEQMAKHSKQDVQR